MFLEELFLLLKQDAHSKNFPFLSSTPTYEDKLLWSWLTSLTCVLHPWWRRRLTGRCRREATLVTVYRTDCQSPALDVLVNQKEEKIACLRTVNDVTDFNGNAVGCFLLF